MINAPAHTSPTVVFTASHDGIYVFTLIPSNNGNIVLTINGDPEITLPTNGIALYLHAADTIEHVGPAVQLAGVRLGDELSDE